MVSRFGRLWPEPKEIAILKLPKRRPPPLVGVRQKEERPITILVSILLETKNDFPKIPQNSQVRNHEVIGDHGVVRSVIVAILIIAFCTLSGWWLKCKFF
jgi:hypothetical protein